MYTGSGFRDWEIGDVDVFIHEGKYHLFHLIIPNHDYIAHAVSDDGIQWKRVNNALFVGHPGEWDDDMLWTMHVSKNEDKFRMYYTGLHQKDRGVIQKIGIAESEDLITWNKIKPNNFPIKSEGPYYEGIDNNPREWLSFRDPFHYEHNGEEYLLICARSSFGPTSRRGCVALLKLENEKYEMMPPILYPMVYDDVECPCVFDLNGRSYIIGSIREDIKVRYWYADKFLDEYNNFRSDVLLPQGNYAARIVRDGEHLLIYNFFFKGGSVDELRVLPPPKQLDVNKDGQLLLRSFYRWDQMIISQLHQNEFPYLETMLSNPTSKIDIHQDGCIIGARSGYEIFTFKKPSNSFIWEGKLSVIGMGKFGLVSDIDKDGNGYYYSFDITHGLVQIRAWGFNEENVQQNFIFNNIQSNIFKLENPDEINFRLIRYGNYIELSIENIVKLTLIDYTYSGEHIGLYSASSEIELKESIFKNLPDAVSEYASQENES
ncbi:glycoside hydrolase family protein [Portibacter lacus]|uniref:beta-fructofuranosidase n=1 Tax=Portibacter lacus TaxID=1099794 RepID=A0AA37SN45_9BACT|nr:hypothetical protein [Portibacter lacus]GLR17656.1 glycosyhydrolase [Portibacter lacus]